MLRPAIDPRGVSEAMTYSYIAKPVQPHTAIVPVLNGLSEKHGHGWKPHFIYWEVPQQIIEEALVEAGYCLDAPDTIPLGACRGEHCYDEFAAAFQIEGTRP